MILIVQLLESRSLTTNTLFFFILPWHCLVFFDIQLLFDRDIIIISSNVACYHHDKADELSFGVDPFSAKVTFLSFMTDMDKRVLYTKPKFAIDTVNIYFNREVTNIYLQIHDIKV